MNYYSIFRPFIKFIEPELAHNMAIQLLKMNLIQPAEDSDSESLKIKALGIDFSNPIGLAAGFDKNGQVFKQIIRQGFGFSEVGTVTPKAQSGNAKPRIFRLEKDEAIINSLGFNNDGLKLIINRLEKKCSDNIVGINLGVNYNSQNWLDDYVKGINSSYDKVNYITINISSPNTPGLRDLHQEEFLKSLLEKINLEVEKFSNHTPILLKISPDINELELEKIISLAINYDIQGMIISNTTIKHESHSGGLSGRPLFTKSNNLLSSAYKMAEGKLIFIGVGGIFSGKDIFEKMAAGASLVQLYTSLTYKGFQVIQNSKVELQEILKNKGFNSVKEIIGINVK